MKALVTGATGCLGRHLIKRLTSDGYTVCGTARNTEIGQELTKQGIEFVPAALDERATITHLCKDKDIVFHCGALTSLWGKYQDFYRANVLGTKYIIEGCLQHNVKRLIYVSTPSLYFNFKNTYQISELSPLPNKKINHYISTKYQAEQLIDQAHKQQQLAVTTLRPRAIFGPYDTTIMPRLISIAQHGSVPLINQGRALIDITYVKNVVSSLLLCAHSGSNTFGKKYNITNGEPITISKLLQTVFSALAMDVHYKAINYKIAYSAATMLEIFAKLPLIKREPRLTRYTVGVFGKSQTLDISAAATDLNYQPKISINRGIQEYATWYKQHHYES